MICSTHNEMALWRNSGFFKKSNSFFYKCIYKRLLSALFKDIFYKLKPTFTITYSNETISIQLKINPNYFLAACISRKLTFNTQINQDWFQLS